VNRTEVQSSIAPGTEGIQAHCQRVATWVRELAGALGLSASEAALVEQAARYHHPGIEAEAEPVRRLLEVFWKRQPIADAAEARLVAALEICDDFDQHFEAEALSPSPVVETMMNYLQLSSRADVNRVINRLPVFPRAAQEIVLRVTNPEVRIGELVQVASLDPVLAGLLVQAANSSYYGRGTPVATIQHAISHIGFDATRKILLGATFRPIYSSPLLHSIWNHSLDVAQAAETLARRSSLAVDPAEAFLGGLVHDVGRVAFAIMPRAFLERLRRLVDGGCALVQSEVCLSGLSHAEVGAETLTQWKFTDAMVDAVLWHHRPERSARALPSLLYLAEFMAGSQEDLPSSVRLKTACGHAGVKAEALSETNEKGREALQGLRFAA